jgi:hypothetical protein
MLLAVMLGLNLLCGVAAGAAVWQLRRPMPQPEMGNSFARVLAGAIPVAACLVGGNGGKPTLPPREKERSRC